MINLSGSGEDRFLPLMFEIRNKFSQTKDLFNEVFNQK